MSASRVLRISFKTFPRLSPLVYDLRNKAALSSELRMGNVRPALVGPGRIGILVDRNGLMIAESVFGGGLSRPLPPWAEIERDFQ